MNEQHKIEQARVLAFGSGWDCYRFAQFVEGADITALQARVLEIGDAWDCCCFAHYIEGADTGALQTRVLEIGSAEERRYFAHHIKIPALQARIKELKEV